MQVQLSIRAPRLHYVTKVLRERRDLARAARRMPRPVPWDWAEPRLVPMLAGPWIDVAGEALVRVRSELGCALVFGPDLGKAAPFVDEILAERWERTPDQLLARAMANLRLRAARIGVRSIRGGTLSGYPFRRVDAGVRWESSLVLVPDELRRLLGDSDQVLVALGHARLLSFPTEMPNELLAGVVVELEEQETYPLLLDPFVLRDGELSWIGAIETDAEEWTW